MKTQVTLTIDADVKDEFQKIAKKLGSNMSTIANMYFTQVVNTGRVEYSLNDEPVELVEVSYDSLSEENKKKVRDIDSRDISSFINI
ncbi:type II toxin-antitoxin system RelB/DinJ family antitoxin [Candidatus Gracilibacteria bacterium]|nr:type II toxin-antitoxin system RelB/DinJ family antitoxin [Candidatus Gracilibacteria bacterium]